MKKNIIFFLDSFGAGGTEKHVLQLIKSSLVKEFHIKLICSRMWGNNLNNFKSSGIGINQFPIYRFFNFWGNIKTIISLAKFLKDTRTDILHSFGNMTNIVGPIAGYIAGVPIIIQSERNTFFWKKKNIKSTQAC